MRLYHFTSTKWGLEAIRKRRLKIARILELNDPFEFISPVAENKSERRAMDGWKCELSERFGLLCLSANWQHPLLWGHYAEKHKGMCLGFDVQRPEQLCPVEYLPARPTLSDFGITSLLEMDEATMLRILHMKFDAWRYEAEYRAFVGLDEVEDGLFFAEFEPVLRLREVIVGHRSGASRTEVAEAIGNLSRVEAFKARPAFQRFEVTRNRNERLWR